jgi:predicted GH43/DUF377 family glycosyl hydrolase
MDRNAGLFRRHDRNPILTARDWPYPANSVFNPGATRLADGTTLLLCRVEDRRGHSHLCAARSADGVRGWEIDPAPTLTPDPRRHPGEFWGIEDPRIVRLEEEDAYAVTYAAYTRGGPAVALAMTDDFRTFERHGVILPPEDKDAALLPRRIDGLWIMVHRPYGAATGGTGDHIWMSCSPDLRHWGSHRIVLTARMGGWWDAHRIGLSTPVIETPEGWLMLYHGARHTPSGVLYRTGVALFDLACPTRCLLRGDEWIMGPEESYELVGDVGGVVFPCGYTIADDSDSLTLYYGAADSCVALATGRVSEILDWVKANGREETAIEPWF